MEAMFESLYDDCTFISDYKAVVKKKIVIEKNTAKKAVNGEPELVFRSFLLPKERTIFKTNPHWLFVAAPEIALAVLGILNLEYLSSLLTGKTQL